jgi:hypothetical protein
MNYFIGEFFSVTKHSMFRIKVKDLVTSPQVMKVRIRKLGKDLFVPVGGVLIGGFYVAITSQGIFKYRMVKHQRAPLDRPPQRIEELSKRKRAMHAFPPIGLFLKRADADTCFDNESTTTFDPDYRSYTMNVLTAIGMNHPLITISTETEFAVPADLYTIVD